MVDWISDTFTSDVGWNHLETLVDIGNRMAGSHGEREGAETYLANGWDEQTVLSRINDTATDTHPYDPNTSDA